ncbi:MAG: insulinase family protein [Bdellovibrionales bacterium]|nr:insulinase family protein [Bdellovibrionales bacterium]
MAKKFQLKNGLTVLLVESHKSPVVSVQMWVNTGCADEKKGEEGLSHFIEHLVFKGTEQFNVGEIASTVEGSGGELNAYTSFDQTVFYVTISKEFSETGLNIISQMMGHPRFDETEINNEREVVIEEIKRGNDSPQRQASRLLFETLYKKHPYRKPVIGYDSVIRNVSVKKIRNYFDSRYVPQLMTLVVVGDFSSAQMKKSVEKYFGDFKPLKPEKRVRPKEEKQKAPRIKVQKSTFEESLFYLAWPAPPATHKDIPALDVLSMIFGQGDSSRLTDRLRLQEGIVNGVGSGIFSPKDVGFFTVSGSFNHKDLSRFLEILNEELFKLLEASPSMEELKKALINFNSDRFYSLETVDGMARRYGSFEHLFGDYKVFDEFLKKVNALSPLDLLKAARKYLVPENMTITFLTPGEPKEQEKHLRKFMSVYKKTFAEAKKTKASAKKTGPQKIKKISFKKATLPNLDIHRFTTATGVEVLVKPNFETPVVSMRVAGLGGVRREDPNHLGMTELLSRVWTAGSSQHSEKQINDRIENLASSIGAFGGRNTAGMSLTTLQGFSDELFDLFFEILKGPLLGTESIEREKRVMLEQIKNRKDNPAQVAILAFMANLFKGHPYAWDPMGTETTVKGLSSEDLRSFWSKLTVHKNLVFVATGAVDPSLICKRIEDELEGLELGHRFDQKFNFTKPNENIRTYERSEKQQTHLVYGFPGLSFHDPRRHALQVLTSILAGQGGRLFLELRDKASLAYSVAPLRMEGIDAGYFGAYIGCSPEKGEKALSMMKQEFQKLAETPVPHAELKRAQRYIVGRHDIELQRNSAVSSSILFDTIYGLPADETFHFAEKIEAVTAEDIRALASDLFSQYEVISAVGPEQPWS